MEEKSGEQIRIGIDIGGTFTDFVIFSKDTGPIYSFKVLSTPHNPAHAVLNGLKQLSISNKIQIIHGSTVATNALLERKGAKTALITTQGFKDLLSIGRQNRASLYDWANPQSLPIVPSELCFEVSERVDCYGERIKPLDKNDIEPITRELIERGVQSVAVSLLFSFLYPEHEREIAKILKSHKFSVSISSDILPEYREYERTSTTAINAYVSPVLDYYLSTLQDNIPNAQLQVMQSNGGMISINEARLNGVRCILSGPSGGIIGAKYLAELAHSEPARDKTGQEKTKLITFDMGGTSTDVSLIDSTPSLTKEATVGGYPISIPIIDIHTIGAGGGSIAYIDQGGALRVGPHSAGADPGPACYGKGNLPTVTDANIVLGRLIPEHFMCGDIKLDPQRSWDFIQKLGAQLGLNTVECALGILAVANVHMERALRVISIERGYDPRDFTLFSFGGAGGLHAVDLARSLRIRNVLVSPYASVLSAFGMLTADIIKDYVQTVMLNNNTAPDKIDACFSPLVNQGFSDIASQGVDHQNIIIERYLDARYQGQSYELTIPYSHDWVSVFGQMHQQTYSYQMPASNIEIVNIRARAIGKLEHPTPAAQSYVGENPEHALIGYRDIIFPGKTKPIPFYDHESLLPGNRLVGPAVIIRPDTTVLIDTDDSLYVDGYLNLCITIGQS
jgi:N-methylhydantoinase A